MHVVVASVSATCALTLLSLLQPTVEKDEVYHFEISLSINTLLEIVG